MPDGFDPREEIFKLRKEFQEYKAKIEEREKWISRFWKERLMYKVIGGERKDGTMAQIEKLQKERGKNEVRNKKMGESRQ